MDRFRKPKHFSEHMKSARFKKIQEKQVAEKVRRRLLGKDPTASNGFIITQEDYDSLEELGKLYWQGVTRKSVDRSMK